MLSYYITVEKMYPHKSGSQKRKERASREEAFSKAQKAQRTLAAFNFQQNTSTSSTIPASDKNSSPGQPEELENSSTQSVSDNIQDEPRNTSFSSQFSDGKNVELDNHENDDTSEEKFVTSVKYDTNKKLDSKLVDKHSYDYDIGTLKAEFLQPQEVQEVLRRGHSKMPSTFPRDRLGEPFPLSLLSTILPNGEKIQRDWLVWSQTKSAFYCLPCRLFSKNTLNRSKMCSPEGYSKAQFWKKLYLKFPSHEGSHDHIQCYVKWCDLEVRIEKDSTVDMLLNEEIASEAKKWREILKRILDTILFLGERGLALRGESNLVGQKNNGNFLGILELIARYDPVLHGHLEKVKSSQEAHQRLQVHYLSVEIQNEFIELCAHHVISFILKEVEKAKYYTIIVDATPDCSHVEQTTFILRYLHYDTEEKVYHIKERFLAFVDCYGKTGEAIADLICQTLEKYEIPLENCRGQGYDNGRNMSGQYKGAQNYILRKNEYAVYSPCGAHTLNLVGVDSAECCAQAITFFGVVQKCYNIFSSSTQRWEILKSNIPDSLHSLSDTRWAARIDGVKPFAKNLPGLRKSLEEIKKLNLTAETLRDVNGILKYMSTFECVLMASIWFKILQAINERNLVLQEMNATIDVEVDNLRSLLADLQLLRDQWSGIYNECKIVADNFIDTSSILRPARKKKRVDSSHDIVNEDCTIEEIDFKRNTFFVIIDSIMSGISRRFQAINELNETFSFLWQFSDTNIQECQTAAEKFAVKYPADVSQNLSNEIIHLKNIYEANFGPQLPPFDLLNAIYAKKLNRLFPNVCIALRIFCTIPVSVASGERSFSVLARIKNFHRSCSTQTRVSSLATLCLEAQLARELDFEELINSFASAKARKAHL